MPAAPVIGAAPPATARIDATALAALLEHNGATVIDLSLSPTYRKGHIPGAWFAVRSRLAKALRAVAPRGELVLTSEDGVLAGLAVVEAAAIIGAPVRYLDGGNAAWQAAKLPLSTEAHMADEPVDAWLKPYERGGDTTDAMNEYLSWEVDLVSRIERDGTCNFTVGQR
jgi:3-mercaptopyruvate sulfurtransferase SseA